MMPLQIPRPTIYARRLAASVFGDRRGSLNTWLSRLSLTPKAKWDEFDKLAAEVGPALDKWESDIYDLASAAEAEGRATIDVAWPSPPPHAAELIGMC